MHNMSNLEGDELQRPQRAHLLLAKSRILRLQWARLSWTGQKKIGKPSAHLTNFNFCCYMQIMNQWILACVNSSGQEWCCYDVGIFSWHTLSPLIPVRHCVNARAYLSIVADHVLSSMVTFYRLLMAASSRMKRHVTNQTSSQAASSNMNITSTVTRSQSIRAPLGCSETGGLQHEFVADKSAATDGRCHVNMEQNL